MLKRGSSKTSHCICDLGSILHIDAPSCATCYSSPNHEWCGAVGFAGRRCCQKRSVMHASRLPARAASYQPSTLFTEATEWLLQNALVSVYTFSSRIQAWHF